MLSVVLLATTPDELGVGPAAAVVVDGRTTLARLLGLPTLAAARVEVVTRPGWEAAVSRAAGRPVTVRSAATAGDLLEVLAAVPPGPLLLAPADVVVHDWTLASVAAHPSGSALSLVGDPDIAPDQPPVRTARGRITAAASPVHTIVGGDAVSLAVVRLGHDDRRALVERRDEFESLLASGVDGSPVDVPDPDGHLLSVLLVAAVRSGRPVVPARLAVAAWQRPAGASAARSALDRLATFDEERVRLRSVVKRDDGFFTTFLVSSYSPYVARFAARRGWTPNQITVASMLVGIAAALAFGTGTRPGAVAGALLLQAAFTLDCVDGQLARYTLQFSAFGAWLDAVFDRGKEYVVYAGLAVGGVRAGDGETLWLLAGLALAVQTFRHTLDFGYAATQVDDLAVPEQRLEEREEAGPSFWEAVAVDPGQATGVPGSLARPTGAQGFARHGVAALRRTDRVGWLVWAKRIVILPIGERFALLSLLAATTTARTTFVALLVWSSLAAGYTFTGRLVRSLA